MKTISLFTALMASALLASVLLTACTDYKDDIDTLSDRVDALERAITSFVYVPTTTDGMMTIGDTDGSTVTLTYSVKPADAATYMKDNKEKLSFVVEEGLTSRAISSTATLTVTSCTSSIVGDEGRITITATANGFSAAKGYAVALNFMGQSRTIQTAFTPVWVKMASLSVRIVAIDGTPEGSTIGANQTLQLRAIMKEGDSVERWDSDNKPVATIDADGFVEGKSEGTVTFSVTTVQGATATFMLRVSAAAIGGGLGSLGQGSAE